MRPVAYRSGHGGRTSISYREPDGRSDALRSLPAGSRPRRARIEFGDIEAYKDSCREASGLAWLDELRGNLRYTLRTLRMSPGFALSAVLSLAVGIGVNISCFISVNSIVRHPFPFPHLDRVITVWEGNAKLRSQRNRVSPGNFFDWKKNTGAFERFGAYQPRNMTLTGVDRPERVRAALVSAGFFEGSVCSLCGDEVSRRAIVNPTAMQ